MTLPGPWNARSRLAVLAAVAAVVVGVLLACDTAFQGRIVSHDASAMLLFEFANGDSELAAIQGDPVDVRVEVPRVGFERMLDPITLAVDPSRLELTADRALGDPAGGGFAPDTNLTAFAVAQGWLSVDDTGATAREIHIAMDSATPLAFPSGLMRLSLRVTDDIDRTTSPFVLELTMLSPQRPTLVLRCEAPPAGTTPTGLSLPLGGDGFPFVGERLPFALIVEGIPNPTTGAGFTLLLGPGGIDPSRLVVTADQDLGDPLDGGFAAGTNLASQFATDLDFIVDPDTGGFVTGMRFLLDAKSSPLLGKTTFSATVIDDADVASDPQAETLAVVTRVTLAGDVQPIFSGHCGFQCHDGAFPFLDLDLSDGNAFAHTVGVRAAETPDDSCTLFRVAPYDADASYLFHKVSNTHLGGCVNGSGDWMPPGLPLGQDDLDRIANWILQGATDD